MVEEVQQGELGWVLVVGWFDFMTTGWLPTVKATLSFGLSVLFTGSSPDWLPRYFLNYISRSFVPISYLGTPFTKMPVYIEIISLMVR